MIDETKLKTEAPVGGPLCERSLLMDSPRCFDLPVESRALWHLLSSNIESDLDALLDVEDRQILLSLLERLTQRLEETADAVPERKGWP
jgi:hypothetical protein